jgi:arylsulfatase A-like enzyme
VRTSRYLVSGRTESGAVADDIATPEVEAYIATVKQNSRANQPTSEQPPWFLAVGFHLPHEPYVIPGAAWEQYDNIELAAVDAKLQHRPFGMPPYALGDVFGENYLQDLEGRGFKYLNPVMKNGTVHRQYEVKGLDYGPHVHYDPSKSPVDNAERGHPYPGRMQYELQRGYSAGVTYMDSQLGVVLDKLDDLGLRKSTVVIFFSDHGYALGERAQWGKRSLFEVG